MIGMISYLPDDTVLRQKRLQCALTTYNYLTKLFPEEIIHIVDQNYTQEDRKLFGSNIKWWCMSYGIGPAKARNFILELFYKSTDDYCILTDDDISFYDYYDADIFMRNLYYGKYNNYGIDIVVPLSPNLKPFKQRLLDAGIDRNFVLFPSSLSDIPNFMLLKNSRKHLFYNDSLDLFSSDIPEDADFILRCMLSKKTCYVGWFIIKKNLALYDSVLFPNELLSDTIEHRRLTANLRSYIESTYKIKMSKFSRRYNSAKTLLIPRDTYYTLPDNLAVVKHKKNNDTRKTRKLF